MLRRLLSESKPESPVMKELLSNKSKQIDIKKLFPSVLVTINNFLNKT